MTDSATPSTTTVVVTSPIPGNALTHGVDLPVGMRVTGAEADEILANGVLRRKVVAVPPSGPHDDVFDAQHGDVRDAVAAARAAQAAAAPAPAPAPDLAAPATVTQAQTAPPPPPAATGRNVSISAGDATPPPRDGAA